MKLGITVVTLCIIMSGCSNFYQNLGGYTEKETLVFVHGAHLSGKSWMSTAKILGGDGINTVLVDLPGRVPSDNPNEITLDISSGALCDALKPIDSSIVLIAHSQGGAVSNNALSICPNKNIKSIIYIAAVAPVDGDTPYSLLSKADELNYLEGIQYDDKSGWMAIRDNDLFVKNFTNSQSSKIKRKVMEQAVNEPAVIGEGVVSYDTEYFATLNKFYIYTQFDKIISLSSQKEIAGRIDIKDSGVINSGHVPMISAPELLASEIKRFLK